MGSVYCTSQETDRQTDNSRSRHAARKKDRKWDSGLMLEFTESKKITKNLENTRRERESPVSPRFASQTQYKLQ